MSQRGRDQGQTGRALVRESARSLARALAVAVVCWAVVSAPWVSANAPAPDPVEAQVMAEETKALRDLVLQAGGFAGRLERYRDFGEHLDALNVLLDAAGPALEVMREVQAAGIVDILALAGALDGGFDFLPQALAAVEQLHGMASELATLGIQLKALTGHIDHLLASERLTPAQLRDLRLNAVPTGQEALRAFKAAYQKVAPGLKAVDQALAELEAEMDALLGQGLNQLGLGNLPPGLVVGGLGGALGGAGIPSLGGLLDPIKALRAEVDDMARSADADAAALSTLAARALDAEAHLAYAQANALIDQGGVAEGRQMLALMASAYPGATWTDKAQQRLKALDQADHERAQADAAEAKSSPLAALVTPSGGVSWWAVLLLVVAASGVGAAVTHRLQRRPPAKPDPKADPKPDPKAGPKPDPKGAPKPAPKPKLDPEEEKRRWAPK